MKRDGAQKSLWQDAIAEYKTTNVMDANEVYDVLIVGAGITGLSTALTMQAEGKKCIVAEAHNIGFGTTGGTTAHLNTLLDTPYSDIEKNFSADEAKLVAKGSREAIDLIEGFVNKYNIDCDFSYQPGYLFAEKDEEVEELTKIKEATERAGVVTTWSDTTPVPVPFKKAMRVEFQGQLHAIRYLAGLAKALEDTGAVIVQNCMVSDVTHDEYFTATTSQGPIKAHHIVYATHIPPGINLLSVRCAPYRTYAAAFILKDHKYPDGLAYDMQDPYHYFRTQTVDGQQYAIIGGFDHKAGHETNTDYKFTELEAYVRKYYDVESVPYKWSSQYYNSVDGLPYIGKLPGHDKIFIATGFGGNGMVLGSLAAKVLCCMAIGTYTPYQDLFDPSRVKIMAGFSDLVKENADVVSQFVGKRFKHEELADLAGLAPGEGKLAEWQGKKVGICKDENGKVFAVDPVCPHAGCIVDWNSAEKSWDCPCHGGSFAPGGEFLGGPAQKGLEPINWEEDK